MIGHIGHWTTPTTSSTTPTISSTTPTRTLTTPATTLTPTTTTGGITGGKQYFYVFKIFFISPDQTRRLTDEKLSGGSCKCGIKKTSRIVGGTETKVKLFCHFLCLKTSVFEILFFSSLQLFNVQPGEWPWIVVFQRNPSEQYYPVSTLNEDSIHLPCPGRMWRDIDCWQLGGDCCTLRNDEIWYSKRRKQVYSSKY